MRMNRREVDIGTANYFKRFFCESKFVNPEIR